MIDHCTITRHYHGTYVRYVTDAGRKVATVRTCPWREPEQRAEVLVGGRIIGYAETLVGAARIADAALAGEGGAP